MWGCFVAGFGEASPEAKAAKNLHNFFTYVAVRIVSAQLEVLLPISALLLYLVKVESFMFGEMVHGVMLLLCE